MKTVHGVMFGYSFRFDGQVEDDEAVQLAEMLRQRGLQHSTVEVPKQVPEVGWTFRFDRGYGVVLPHGKVLVVNESGNGCRTDLRTYTVGVEETVPVDVDYNPPSLSLPNRVRLALDAVQMALKSCQVEQS